MCSCVLLVYVPMCVFLCFVNRCSYVCVPMFCWSMFLCVFLCFVGAIECCQGSTKTTQGKIFIHVCQIFKQGNLSHSLQSIFRCLFYMILLYNKPVSTFNLVVNQHLWPISNCLIISFLTVALNRWLFMWINHLKCGLWIRRAVTNIIWHF